MAWPIDDPALIERLTLPHDDFRALMDDFVGMLELPPWDEAFFERAISYPWARPSGSYALDGERVVALDPVAAAAIGGLPDYVAGGRASAHERVPLLAVGSNGAPSTLVRKFAHLPETEQRVIVVAGHLGGFDIGPVARFTPYGSLPATPFASPGTAVRASVLWVTTAQLTALTWSEMSYLLGWLDPVRFEPDEPPAATGTPEVRRALIYVSRWGTLTGDDGRPLALDALSARGRTAAAVTQEDLLARVAAAAGAPDGRALLQRLVDAPRAFMRELEPWLSERAAPFSSERWRPYPGEPDPRGKAPPA